MQQQLVGCEHTLALFWIQVKETFQRARVVASEGWCSFTVVPATAAEGTAGKPNLCAYARIWLY